MLNGVAAVYLLVGWAPPTIVLASNFQHWWAMPTLLAHPLLSFPTNLQQSKQLLLNQWLHIEWSRRTLECLLQLVRHDL